MNNYYVINLEEVDIEEDHPYTLIFKGYIPTFGGSRLYTFKYGGAVTYTDAAIAEDIKEDFAEQLSEDYGCGYKFDLTEVKEKLEAKHQYRMKMV